MCNPRRVEVTAATQLTEAWEHEVRRLATLTGEAIGEARVREPLDGSVGAPTLAALVQVLESAEGWTVDGDTYRYEIDGGYVAYHADTQELEIVAQVHDQVEVQGSASTVLRGEIDEAIEARGVGTYYDDEWGGITESDARRAAAENAQRNLAAQGRERIDEARRAAEQEHGDALAEAAREQASATLAEQIAARAAQLRADAARQLTAIGIQGRNIFYQVLAQAYRDAILAYARSRGAEHVTYSEQDGVLEIEFDLQV